MYRYKAIRLVLALGGEGGYLPVYKASFKLGDQVSHEGVPWVTQNFEGDPSRTKTVHFLKSFSIANTWLVNIIS